MKAGTEKDRIDLSPAGLGHRLVEIGAEVKVADKGQSEGGTKDGIAGAIQVKTKVETVLLSAVPPGHEFVVRVSARNAVGWAEWGTPLHFRLVALSPL